MNALDKAIAANMKLMTDNTANLLDMHMRSIEICKPDVHRRLFNEIIDRNIAGNMTEERAHAMMRLIRKHNGWEVR